MDEGDIWGCPEDFDQDDEPVIFEDVVVVGETPAALQVHGLPSRPGCLTCNGTWWVPRSQIVLLGAELEVEKLGDTGPIGIRAWFVDQKERQDGEAQDDE
jgi:hypothetical protein